MLHHQHGIALVAQALSRFPAGGHYRGRADRSMVHPAHIKHPSAASRSGSPGGCAGPHRPKAMQPSGEGQVIQSDIRPENPSRALISFRTRSAMAICAGSQWSSRSDQTLHPCEGAVHRPAGDFDDIVIHPPSPPALRGASASPLQVGQGRSLIYSAILLRMYSDWVSR